MRAHDFGIGAKCTMIEMNLFAVRWHAQRIPAYEAVRNHRRDPLMHGPLRGFANDRIVELVTEGSLDVQADADLKNHLTIVFDKPATVETGLLHYTVESWLIWAGPEPLRLAGSPTIL